MQNRKDHWTYTREPSSFARDYLFYSNCVGHNPKGLTLSEKSKYYPCFTLIYVNFGELKIEFRDNNFTVKEKEAILMFADNKPNYYYDKNNSSDILLFDFNGKSCQDIILQIIQNTNLPIIYRSDQIPQIIYKMKDIYNINNANYSELAISTCIYEILCDLCLSVAPNTESENSISENNFMNAVNNYIDTHVKQHITLDNLAETVSMSKYHFIRIFKKYNSKTPIQYVLSRKIQKSKITLSFGEKKISEIAEDLGFVDQNHFIKVFKNMENVTPSEYMKNCKHEYPSN